MHQNIVDKCNKVAFSIISVMIGLLPFLFLPVSVGGVLALKGVLFYTGTFLAVSIWFVGQFIAGSITVPKSKTLLFVAGWVALSFIGALISKNVSVSLWGRGFALDSFATTLALGLFAFIVATIAMEEKRLAKLFVAGFLGSVITIVLQVILYVSQNTGFVAKHFAAVSNQGTLVGSWIDFGYFVSFTFLLSLLMCEVLRPKKLLKIFSYVALGVTLVVMAFLNIGIVWIISTIAALIVFVYKSSIERSGAQFLKKLNSDLQEDDSKVQVFPFFAFGSLLIGLFFFLSSASVGYGLARYAGVVFNDIRPSFGATAEVVRSSLHANPAFGVGAGRFSSAWNLYHPAGINQTTVWNTPFETGYSFFESLFATNGILPVLALLAIFILVIIQGFKSFAVALPDKFSRFISVTSLVVVTVFFILTLISTPGFILIVMSFLYLGILMGIPSLADKKKVLTFHYLKDPRTSFFAILVLVVAIMTSFSAVYFSLNKFAGTVYYNKAFFAKDAPTAIDDINEAVQLSANDVYLQARTNLFINQFNTEAKKENPDKTALQGYFSSAEQSAQAAVAWDNTDASNWLSLSQVYQLVINKDKPETAQNAEQAALQAKAHAPKNPLPLLSLAQISIATGNTDKAYGYIADAISLKPNYLDAYVLKAQLKQSAGDSNGARDALLSYTKVEPFDPSGYVVLGNYYVGIKDTANALDAFTQVKSLSPNTQGIDEVLAKLKQGGSATVQQPAVSTTTPAKAPVVKKPTTKKK